MVNYLQSTFNKLNYPSSFSTNGNRKLFHDILLSTRVGDEIFRNEYADQKPQYY